MQKQSQQTNSEIPKVLLWDGQQPWQRAHLEEKFYNGRRLTYWRGFVSVENVRGWVQNPRIDLFVKKFMRDHDGQLPGNDEILADMLKDSELDIEGLAENIAMNGVHEAIIVTHTGTLLDGNRRYYASLYRYRRAQESDDKDTVERTKYLPAYVLLPTATDDDLEAILIMRNYGRGFHQAWPDYIRAQKIRTDFDELIEAGADKKFARREVAAKYNEKDTQIVRFERMMKGVDEFRDFHLTGDEEEGRVPKDALDVEQACHDYFQYFDELTKPAVWRVMTNDQEMRATTFERLFNGEFISFTRIRKIPEIAAEPRARDVFIKGAGPDKNAVEEAIDIVNTFHLVKKAVGTNEKIQSFAKWLRALRTEDYGTLEKETAEDLRDIANLAAKLASAVEQPEPTAA